MKGTVMENNYIYGIKCWDKFPDVTVSIETITPQVAIAMLENNINNRKAKRYNHVQRAIKNGEFVLNGATIVFSKEGKLLDGQHRLIACVTEQTPITTLVVRGIDDNAQTSMDQGIKRTVGDFLKMRGVKDSSLVGTIALSLMTKDAIGLEDSIRYGNSNHYYNPTALEIVSFAENNYEKRIKPIKQKTAQIGRYYKGLTPRLMCKLFEEFRAVDIESFEQFYGMLIGKYQPTKTMMLLQNRLRSNGQTTNGRLPDIIVAALIIKTWNAYMEGRELGTLRFKVGGAAPDEFPSISYGYNNDGFKVVVA